MKIKRKVLVLLIVIVALLITTGILTTVLLNTTHNGTSSSKNSLGSALTNITIPVNRPLNGISLNKSSLSLTSGNSETLSVSYDPDTTTDSKEVTWKSSNTSVVSISNGTITAEGTGTATVTATVSTKTASCKVTVKSVPSNTYMNISRAYTELNSFRTSKGVWYWNSTDQSKTYFNTNSSNQLTALKRDASLEKTAQLRAKEIVTNFAHTRPDGSSCFTAYPSNFSGKGENIAYGYNTAVAVTEAWKETSEKYSGQGHRRNMLNKNYKYVGIASYSYNGTLYWVQCFGY